MNEDLNNEGWLNQTLPVQYANMQNIEGGSGGMGNDNSSHQRHNIPDLNSTVKKKKSSNNK
jgi:hypothetical protein